MGIKADIGEKRKEEKLAFGKILFGAAKGGRADG
jgi:hypothetical protein